MYTCYAADNTTMYRNFCGNSFDASEKAILAHAVAMACAFIFALTAVVNVVLSGIIIDVRVISIIIIAVIIITHRCRGYNLHAEL